MDLKVISELYSVLVGSGLVSLDYKFLRLESKNRYYAPLVFVCPFPFWSMNCMKSLVPCNRSQLIILQTSSNNKLKLVLFRSVFTLVPYMVSVRI